MQQVLPNDFFHAVSNIIASEFKSQRYLSARNRNLTTGIAKSLPRKFQIVIDLRIQ